MQYTLYRQRSVKQKTYKELKNKKLFNAENTIQENIKNQSKDLKKIDSKGLRKHKKEQKKHIQKIKLTCVYI